MGQAKRRGSREDRIAQAMARPPAAYQIPKQTIASRPKPVVGLSKERLSNLMQNADSLFSKLTTPSDINAQVSFFSKLLSTEDPIFLECHPELWARQSCCDANVTKYIEYHGGRMLCGYRIWYNEPLYIEGERHAVWIDGEVIRDVSFVDSGETEILFVPDNKKFDDAPEKIRHAFDESAKKTIVQFEEMEKLVPIGRLSPKEAWDTMLTYERWLAGDRMPNFIRN
jgi:hypothetical protein